MDVVLTGAVGHVHRDRVPVAVNRAAVARRIEEIRKRNVRSQRDVFIAAYQTAELRNITAAHGCRVLRRLCGERAVLVSFGGRFRNGKDPVSAACTVNKGENECEHQQNRNGKQNCLQLLQTLYHNHHSYLDRAVTLCACG